MNRNTQVWVGWAMAGLAPVALFLLMFDLGNAAPPLRIFLGWGAFLAPPALFAGGLALVEADRRRWLLRWQAVAWGELFVLCLLGLSHLGAGDGLAGALLGRRGGLAGWGVSQAVEVVLPRVLAWIALLLLTFGSLAGLLRSLPGSWLDWLRARLPLSQGRAWLSQLPHADAVGQHVAAGLHGAADRVKTLLTRGRDRAAPSIPEPDDLVSERTPASSRRAAAATAEKPAKSKDLSRRRRPRNARLVKRPEWLPPMALLREDAAVHGQLGSAAYSADARQRAQLIKQTLADFGVPVEVVSIKEGPTVTQFGIEPGETVRERDGELIRRRVSVQRILRLRDDLALELAAASLRIEAPVPGRPYVGVEVPNTAKVLVSLRNILESDTFLSVRSPLAIALGRDVSGDPVVADLARMPHLLIAGATGSGKSVCINAIVTSLLMSNGPEAVRFVMVDPKMVELPGYNGIPHLLQPVVTNPKKAYGVLNWAVMEMDRRYNLIAERNVREINAYNSLAEHFKDEDFEFLPHILIVIDELADLMYTTATEVEDAISRLMAKARAAGIHLIIATQRPSVDVITGVIKANIPSRIAFAVSAMVDSRTILDTGGAEKLLGKGDMLYSPVTASKMVRGQCALVTDNEVEDVLQFIKSHSDEDYVESVGAAIDKAAAGGDRMQRTAGEDGEDELLFEALTIFVEAGHATVSLLQRRLAVGHPRAARLVDRLEQLGLIGPSEGSKPRKVIVSKSEFEAMLAQRSEEESM